MDDFECREHKPAKLAEQSNDEALAVACICSCLTLCRANTLPMLEIMRACKQARPYREVEDEVDALAIMHLSHNNAHVLSNMLVHAGALEKIEVPEAGETEAGNEAACDVLGDEPNDWRAADTLEDMPTDYLLKTTDAGLAVLDDFEPTKRFVELIAGEPEPYADVYQGMLAFCMDGASFPAIEEAFSKHPAMKTPKTVYPGHFVSNLETIGAIAWENEQWVTTEGGKASLAGLSASADCELAANQDRCL